MNRPPARLLIVEDERAQRAALRTFFNKQGLIVDDVASGAEALHILEGNRYDVLLTDLRLPDIQGTEVIQAARERDPDIGVLLMTAFASVESAVQALRLGAHDYLLKPLILADVARKIDHLLAHRLLLRENARLRAALQNLHPSGASALVARAPAMRKSWTPSPAPRRSRPPS
jgi:DNA-binding NtrC family response regulator